MSIRLGRLAAPLAIVGFVISLGHAIAVADPSAAPGASAPASSVPAAETASVNTLHFAYNPNPITVAVGAKVTFKNSDEIAHTVTSEDGGDKPAFDSGDMAQNATWSHVFAKAGTYNYFCTYHSYMKGVVIVK